ncbi:MAG: OB-fold nucleic acid binding domain-containing protein [Candidatus Nanohaloarchaea archaeon]
MRNVNLKARITNILDANTFDRDDGSEGKVQNIVLADESGSIRVTLWDEQTEIAEKVEEGDAIEVHNAYTVEDDRGNAELRLGDESQVKMAEDDEVPEVDTSGGSTGETEEASIREVKSENASYRVKGLLVNIYTSNPFYNRCPECGTSVREDDDGDMVCEDHGEIEDPDKALAVSAVIDDGTGNIRAVFFRDLAREMLEIDEKVEEEGDIEAVEDAAADAVGKELVIEGRTRYNDYFGRLEMIANEMDEVDVEQEIENLMETMEA